MTDTLTVSEMSEEEFAGAREEWQRLLVASDADPLFMSWDWQWRWWKHFKTRLRATLRLLRVTSANGALIGIVPFYLTTELTRGVLPTRRLQLLGVAWRQSGVAFSEYLDFIIDREHAAAARRSIASWVEADSRWQDLLIACARDDSHATQVVRSIARDSWVVREVDPLVSQRVGLDSSFEAWLATLSGNTRRRVFLQRSHLPEGKLVSVPPEESGAYLEKLRAFRAARWGAGAASAETERFDQDIAGSMAGDRRLQLTALVDGDRVLSVMYNIRVDRTEYYLQSGFDPRPMQGLSPGWLHLGYVIERAARDGVKWFDLLGGTGLHSDYKRELVTEKSRLACYHVVRAPWLCALYRLRDLWPRAAGSEPLARCSA